MKPSKSKSKIGGDVTRTPSARKARRSLRSGYAFAHQVISKICFINNFLVSSK